jgi:hypothetical protein
MSHKCSECGAILSTYNSGQVCYPCQKKRKDAIVERISTSKCERLEYLDFLLGTRTGEKIRALPQKSAIASGLHIGPEDSKPTGNRQESLEKIEHNLLNWKPRVQITLNPLAARVMTPAKPAVRYNRA